MLTSLLLPHLSSSLTDSLPSLNLLSYSKTDARFLQDGRKTVWSIPYVSVAFFPCLKQTFIAYRSSKMSDCIFEIHQLWQSGFSRVYSNCCCRCSFEREIIKIGQSSNRLYNNNIMNFQESTTVLNSVQKSLETYWRHHVYSIPGRVTAKTPQIILDASLLNTQLYKEWIKGKWSNPGKGVASSATPWRINFWKKCFKGTLDNGRPTNFLSQLR